MSFINVFEELSSLYESEAVEVAADEATKEEEAIDSGCDEEATEDELNEGIFDSKATKQKAYEKEVNDIFGAPSGRLASEISSNITDVIESVAYDSGEDEDASITTAKNMIKLLKGAMAEAKGKTPLALVRAVISIGSKYKPNADGLDELKEFVSKAGKLSDMKSRQYLMGKVNATAEQRMNHTINFLKKEFGIRESLEDVGAEGDVESDVVDEAEVVEPKQLILECSKCGALVIKDESDIELDEEADLVNVNDECAFCEETVGYTIVGAVVPYEVVEVENDAEIEEALDEGIFDKFKKKDVYGDTTVLAKDLAVGDAIKDPYDKFSERFYKIKDIDIDQSKVLVKFDDGVTSTFKHNQKITKITQRPKSGPAAGERVSAEELNKGDVIVNPKRRGEKIKISKVTRWPEVIEIADKGGNKFNLEYGTKVIKCNESLDEGIFDVFGGKDKKKSEYDNEIKNVLGNTPDALATELVHDCFMLLDGLAAEHTNDTAFVSSVSSIITDALSKARKSPSALIQAVVDIGKAWTEQSDSLESILQTIASFNKLKEAQKSGSKLVVHMYKAINNVLAAPLTEYKKSIIKNCNI